MVYYLKIAGIGVKVDCPNNLYLFDEWKIFFEEKWGKNYMVKKVRPLITIILNGIKTKGLKTIPETIPKKSINLPKVMGNKIYFDNLFNSSYLLVLLKKSLDNLISKKGGVVMHASGVVINNKALLIMGESGSGKTTTLQKLINKYKAIAEDDVVIIKKNKKIWAYPVLFSNKLDSSQMISESVEVGAIMTIIKGERINLRKMTEIEAVNFLLDQSKSVINNEKRAKLVIKQAKLLRHMVFILECRKDDNLDGIIERLKL